MTSTTEPISDFAGLIAVVTGGGTGMGRELTRQLAASGCNVAICDVNDDAMSETLRLAAEDADGVVGGVTLTSFVADVADAARMHAFAADVADRHETTSVELLFNNAGISGGGSFVTSSDAEWDRVFGITWGGVLNGTRAFLPMLRAAERAQVTNTSSINGFWACMGPTGAHTAYSSAKFAVKGFTESLMVDFRVNAPHITAAVVMPGHVGTPIGANSRSVLGADTETRSTSGLESVRAAAAAGGTPLDAISDEDLARIMEQRMSDFEHNAPTSAAEAATIILDGVRSGTWRILVGQDAVGLDQLVRADPESAYSTRFIPSRRD